MNEWVNQTRSISLQNDIPPCSCCWISWTVLTPQQSSALWTCPHPAPPCLLCLRFLMTKCIETIGWTLPSIRWHSEGSLCGSGPQDFRQLTKQLLLTLDWLAAMLFSPTGKGLCESARLNEVIWPWSSVHLLPHQARSSRFLSVVFCKPLLYCICAFWFDIYLKQKHLVRV